MPSALDRVGKLTLMLGAGAGHPAGQNLGTLAGKAAKPRNVFVIYIVDLIGTESAGKTASSVLR